MLVKDEVGKPNLEDLPIVRECLDVFLDDLSDRPLDREVEFLIDLAPRTAPISKLLIRWPRQSSRNLRCNLRRC